MWWPPAPRVTSTFPGLTSRWRSPRSWAASSAEAICSINPTTRSGSSGPSRSRISRRSLPSTHRIAMKRRPSASPSSYTGMMFGWSISAASRDSRSNRSRKLWSETSALASTFSATVRPSRRCSARYTIPIPPRPASAWMRYPANSRPISRSPLTVPQLYHRDPLGEPRALRRRDWASSPKSVSRLPAKEVEQRRHALAGLPRRPTLREATGAAEFRMDVAQSGCRPI